MTLLLAESYAPVVRCPHCLRELKSRQVQRIHERQAHADTFHAAETQVLVGSVWRARRWTEEELEVMAAYEASLTCCNINQAILALVEQEMASQGSSSSGGSPGYRTAPLCAYGAHCKNWPQQHQP